MHVQFNIMYMYEGVAKNKPMLQMKQEVDIKDEKFSQQASTKSEG